MPSAVLFVDPPAFCAAVERVVAPALRTRPVAVAHPGGDRATVLALSAEAAEAGVARGMPVRLARRRCPDLVLLPPNPRLYARASRALHEILRGYAPVIEPLGWGHAFLDLAGTERLFGPPVDVAARLAREVHERLRLPLTVGVAANKLVSRAAAAVLRLDAPALVRAGHAVEAVRRGDEAGFLAPRPVAVLPELPPAMRARLDDYQLERVGEVAAIPEPALCAVFGAPGRRLRAAARGIDPRPVLPPERRAEFHASHTLAADTNERGRLDALLRHLAERIGRRLRERRLAATRLVVELTYADYTTAARAVRLRPAALDAELWEAARRGFALACTKRLAVRTVALGAGRLVEASAQLDLWDALDALDLRDALATAATAPASAVTPPLAPVRPATAAERPRQLQHALDRIRTRYGVHATGVHATGGERMARVGSPAGPGAGAARRR